MEKNKDDFVCLIRDIENKKICYTILESETNLAWNFLACIVIEGETGYYKTNWDWGSDRDIADATAKARNSAMGISEEEARKMVLKSMFPNMKT